MFELKCCEHKRCKTDQEFVLMPSNKDEAYVLMTRAHCTGCQKSFTLITKYKFEKESSASVKTKAKGDFKPVYRLFAGIEADRLFNKIYEESGRILFEIIRFRNHKKGFYLNYSEYGKIKRCYSNLSTIKLGLVKSNFEDLERNKNTLI